MKRHEGQLSRTTGEYTYTSDLKKMNQGGGGGGNFWTEHFGYFHIANQHNDSTNRQVWDKMHINNSNFGRDVLHCIHSQNFNPWCVMERYPHEVGDMDIYLIYACGRDFVLSGASLKLEMVVYASYENRNEVENRFQVVFNEPLVLEGDAAQGYQKRRIASFNMQPGPNNGENTNIAFRLSIEAQVDN